MILSTHWTIPYFTLCSFPFIHSILCDGICVNLLLFLKFLKSPGIYYHTDQQLLMGRLQGSFRLQWNLSNPVTQIPFFLFYYVLQMTLNLWRYHKNDIWWFQRIFSCTILHCLTFYQEIKQTSESHCICRLDFGHLLYFSSVRYQ